MVLHKSLGDMDTRPLVHNCQGLELRERVAKKNSKRKEKRKNEQKRKRCPSLKVCNIVKGKFMAGENERVEFVHEETVERQVIMPSQEGRMVVSPSCSK